MKHLALATVAAGALVFGVAAATAQPGANAPRDREPAATSQPVTPHTTQPRHRATEGFTVDRRGSHSAPPNERAMTRDRNGRSAAETPAPAGRLGTAAPEPHRGAGPTNGRGRAAQQRSRERSEAGEQRPIQPSQAAEPRSRDHMQDDRSLTRREFRQRQDGESAQRLQRSRRETTGPGESATQTAAREGRADRSQQRSSTSLSPDQRSRFAARLSDRLEPMNVQPIPRSEISASIGRAIPRSVRLHRLPPDVISIYPQFRGYSFVLVENEFVIVEPGSRRVVAMIPRSGVGYASRETTGFSASGRLRLSSNQRRVIRTTVLREPSCHYEQRVDFFLFMPFPRTVEICEFPRRVIAEVPEIRGYRYAVYGNDVVVVDPNEDSVIEIIR